MIGLLAQKLGMTRITREDGTYVPVTVVRALPNRVLQIKTKERDGYNAVVLGVVKERSNGSVVQLAASEFRVDDVSAFTKGQAIAITDLPDPKVCERITGTSKGKGFQGSMKRHNFSGHPASHGAQFHRTGGSTGCRKPRRVKPGKRMPGHMGSDTVTLKNIAIEKIDAEHHLLALQGPLPGSVNSYVRIELAAV